MSLTREDFKVDQTCIPLAQEGRVIFFTNINVPVAYLSDDETVDRLTAFVQNEYSGIPRVYIQLTATYSLENIRTGAQREWVGNFFPRSNYQHSITPFFELVDFAARARESLRLPTILQSLTLPEGETVWAIGELHSVIVNVQAKTSVDHPSIQRRGLRVNQHGRARRNHVTYAFR